MGDLSAGGVDPVDACGLFGRPDAAGLIDAQVDHFVSCQVVTFPGMRFQWGNLFRLLVVYQHAVAFRTNVEIAVGGFGEGGYESRGATEGAGQMSKGVKTGPLGIDYTDPAFGGGDPFFIFGVDIEVIDSAILNDADGIGQRFRQQVTCGDIPGEYVSVNGTQ